MSQSLALQFSGSPWHLSERQIASTFLYSVSLGTQERGERDFLIQATKEPTNQYVNVPSKTNRQCCHIKNNKAIQSICNKLSDGTVRAPLIK